VVALAVFGPKGLAEAAKSLGSAVRAFAPTLREVTSISNDLKSTLEDELGLDDIKQELNEVQSNITGVMSPTPSGSATRTTNTKTEMER